MRYRYDTDAGALYVSLLDGGVVAATRTLSDPNVQLDVDAQGRPLGLEVIQPERPWPVQEIREAVGEQWQDLISAAFTALGITDDNTYPSFLASEGRELTGA